MQNTISYDDCPRTLRINRLALLEFYDTKPEASFGHASAINGVSGEDLGSGLLRHYLENVTGAHVTIRHDERCNTGKRCGPRLDRWILVKCADGETLYQVEIKNWSAHSFGGNKLDIDASPETVINYKKRAWKKAWDDGKNDLRAESTRKVLLPMKSPREEVKPLLCMWEAMHENGDAEPFFSVATSNPVFPRLYVFSMSAYLRTLTDPYLDIEMPQTIQRLAWLNRLFVDTSANPSVR